MRIDIGEPRASIGVKGCGKGGKLSPASIEAALVLLATLAGSFVAPLPTSPWHGEHLEGAGELCGR